MATFTVSGYKLPISPPEYPQVAHSVGVLHCRQAGSILCLVYRRPPRYWVFHKDWRMQEQAQQNNERQPGRLRPTDRRVSMERSGHAWL